MAERYGHKHVVQEGDEYVCRACWKRWDAVDENTGGVPPCQPAALTGFTLQTRRYRNTSTFHERKAQRKARR